MGAADDTTAAIHLAAMAPEQFSRLVIFSPYMDEPDFQSIQSLDTYPERVYLEWSQFEPSIRDENSDYRESARRLWNLFESKGYQLKGGEISSGPGWISWIRRIDHVLEFALPVE